MDLASLADVYPSITKPDFAPIDTALLETAFSFRAGPTSLTEAELGVPVDVRALGGNQSAMPASHGPKSIKPTKIKLKVVPKK